MVFLALLRDSARLHLQLPVDRRKAVGRDRDVRLDRAAVLPAVARQLAGQVVDLSAALSQILLGARRRRADPRILRQEPGGAALCDPEPARGVLLFRPLPDHPSYSFSAPTPRPDSDFYPRGVPPDTTPHALASAHD